MFECLKGYIGLSSKDSTTAPSGLYVDSLPDISISNINKIADDEQSDYNGVWKDIETRGLLKFRTLFISSVNRCHRINNVEVCECLICENKELLSTALWYLLGAEIMFERVNSSRLNRYTTIDREKAKNIRDEFMDIFTTELETAVNGIDIHKSACVEGDEVAERRLISTFIPIM